MAERYRRSVGQISPSAAQLRAPISGAAYGVNVAGNALAGLGGALGKLAQMAYERQKAEDAASLANAKAAYKNGMNAHKRGGGGGDIDATMDYSDKLAGDISGQLQNDNQRAQFGRYVYNTAPSYGSSAARRQAGESRANMNASFNRAYEADNRTMYEAEGDRDIYESTMRSIDETVEAQHYGKPPDVIEGERQKQRIKAEKSFIDGVGVNDPEAALKLSQESEVFDKKTRDAYVKKYQGQVNRQRGSSVGGEAYTVYEDDDEGAAQYIEENTENEEQRERAQVAYQSSAVSGAQEKKEQAAAQEDYFNKEVIPQYEAGRPPSAEARDKMLAEGKISERQYEAMRALDGAMMEKKKAYDELSQDPAFARMTAQQQDEAVMRRRGITKEDHDESFARLRELVEKNDGSAAVEVSRAHAVGMITEGEKTRLLERLKWSGKADDGGYAKRRGAFAEAQEKDMYSDIGAALEAAGVNDKALKNRLESEARRAYFDEVSRIPEDAPDYQKQMIEAKRRAVINAAGQVLRRQRQRDNAQYIFDENDWEYERAQNDARRGTPVAPTVNADEVSLPSRVDIGRAQAESLRNIPGPQEFNVNAKRRNDGGQMVREMVTGGRRTSRYGERIHPITKKKQMHAAVDYAAPEGTDIRVPNVGGLTVQYMSNSAAKSGNGTTVYLNGKMPDGNDLTIEIRHMQVNSIKHLKKGQRVNPGDLIGKVGSTGTCTGPHVDLRIRVNGKYVDPERFAYSSGKPKGDAELKTAPAENAASASPAESGANARVPEKAEDKKPEAEVWQPRAGADKSFVPEVENSTVGKPSVFYPQNKPAEERKGLWDEELEAMRRKAREGKKR